MPSMKELLKQRYEQTKDRSELTYNLVRLQSLMPMPMPMMSRMQVGMMRVSQLLIVVF